VSDPEWLEMPLFLRRPENMTYEEKEQRRSQSEPKAGLDRVVSGQLTNERLRNFAIVWKVDGDLMRCTGCNKAIIASRKNEIPVHAHDCPKDGYMDNQNPWLLLTEWLLAH